MKVKFSLFFVSQKAEFSSIFPTPSWTFHRKKNETNDSGIAAIHRLLMSLGVLDIKKISFHLPLVFFSCVICSFIVCFVLNLIIWVVCLFLFGWIENSAFYDETNPEKAPALIKVLGEISDQYIEMTRVGEVRNIFERFCWKCWAVADSFRTADRFYQFESILTFIRTILKSFKNISTVIPTLLLPLKRINPSTRRDDEYGNDS